MEDGTYIDAADGAFYIATHVSGPCIIGAGGDDPGQSTFGQWKSIHDQIPYLSGNVYRLRYTLSTDQTDREQVPNVRLFADCVDAPDTKLASNGGMRIGRGIFAPDTNGETYNVYFGPPDLSGTEISHIRLNFEVIDFSPEELGTNFLEKVEVERFPTPDISEGAPVTSYSGSGFSEWTSNTPGAPFGTATAGSDSSGLYLTTPGPYNTDAINYGLWYLDANSPTAVTFQADLLYRAVFRVSTPDPAEVDTVGKIRVFTQNRAANWTSLLVLDPSFLTNHMPTVAGRDYDVWFESPPQLYGNDDDRMSFSFDISDGKDDQEGTVYLNELRIYTYDIPPM